MGSAPAPKKLSCFVCNHQICSQCSGCNFCNPVRSCQQCRKESKTNPIIGIALEDFKDIYQSGRIKKMQAASCKGISLSSTYNLTFIQEKLCLDKIRHLHILLYIDARAPEDGRKYLVAVEGKRLMNGKMKIAINPPYKVDHNFEPIDLPEGKSFKDFFDHLRKNQENKEYHRYTNNCYHFGIRVFKHLKPDIGYKVLEPMQKQKDEQVAAFWGQ